MASLVKQVLSRFPTNLPIGNTEFKAWLDSVVELAGPIADTDSLKWVISNEIMRLPPGKCKVPKHLFVKLLRKYAANQLAANQVIELKAKQDKANQEAAAKAAEEKQKVEAPTIPTGTSADGTGSQETPKALG